MQSDNTTSIAGTGDNAGHSTYGREQAAMDTLVLRILDLVGSGTPTDGLLAEAVRLLAEWSGFEAVGLRLRTGHDYPYHQVRGLSEEFVRLENSLCPNGHGDTAQPGPHGGITLECACGMVIQGRLDPSMPFVTPYGSVWTNSNTRLMAEHPGLREQLRGRCIGAGYETSVLIPIRLGGETFGLLQLEDRRPDLLTTERLACLERICLQIALALSQRQAVDEQRRVNEELEFRVRHKTGELELANEALRREIEERRRTEHERETRLELLRLVKAGMPLDGLMRQSVELLKQGTGFDAVGLRLREGEDFPYLHTQGLSAEFVRLENSLCPRNHDGEVVLGADGKPALECVCGGILSATLPPALPFVSGYGSFFTNSTTVLIQERPELLSVIRGRCVAEGYESVALIPLRFEGRTLGLLQLCDKRRNMLAPRLLTFLERMADDIALALSQRQAAEELRQANVELESRVAERTAALAQANERLTREVAERRQAEEDLKASYASLERKSRELQEFAYVASHDLQEPLRKIQTFGGMVRRRHAERLGAEGQDLLERMEKAAARMQHFILDLLEYSRVTTMARTHQQIDLAAAARDALANLDVRLRESGGKVEIGVMPHVEADQFQMRQLFQNLIGNGLKFRCDKPPVVRIQAERDRGAWRILVQDNGIGFDEKYLERIFVPFQRLHGMGTYEGTGIGLAICRKIAEYHGGSLTARSTPGQGSTFILTLPS